MNASEVTDANWMGLEWSKWHSLNPERDQISQISNDPGLYRVRHQDRDGLEYIGQTGRSTRGRVGALARGVYSDEMPYRDPHTAAPCLWAVRDRYGPELEVSATMPDVAKNDAQRKGLEEALIAVARREMGESPTANFGRIIEGYSQSSYCSGGYVGGRLSEGEEESNSKPGRSPVPWANVEELTSSTWMGLEWTGPYQLADRLEPELPEAGVYRIREEDQHSRLLYIGETSDFTGRLRRHEKAFGSDALFSVAAPNGMDARHKRTEVETELIGAHYLVTEEPPKAQFGN